MAEFGSFALNVTRFVLNWLVRSIFAGIVVYIGYIAFIRYNWFTWHVVLCTVGIFPLMAEALMLFASDELWTRQLTRKQKYWIHGVLISVGAILVSIGCIETFIYIKEGYHLYTVHGITGLIAMILYILSMGLGVAANYSQKLRNYGRPVMFKFIHNSVGLFGYIIGVVSLCYAYYTHWFIYYTTAESRLVALIATILATLWTINSALVSAYGQLKALLEKQ